MKILRFHGISDEKASRSRAIFPAGTLESRRVVGLDTS